MSVHDGSAGWLAGILGNGPLFGMFLDHAVFEEVFGPPRSVLAGSLNPLGGRAEPVPGGFRFNGRATNVSSPASSRSPTRPSRTPGRRRACGPPAATTSRTSTSSCPPSGPTRGPSRSPAGTPARPRCTQQGRAMLLGLDPESPVI
jgi:hypothetical protein